MVLLLKTLYSTILIDFRLYSSLKSLPFGWKDILLNALLLEAIAFFSLLHRPNKVCVIVARGLYKCRRCILHTLLFIWAVSRYESRSSPEPGITQLKPSSLHHHSTSTHKAAAVMEQLNEFISSVVTHPTCSSAHLYIYLQIMYTLLTLFFVLVL